MRGCLGRLRRVGNVKVMLLWPDLSHHAWAGPLAVLAAGARQTCESAHCRSVGLHYVTPP